jgi:histidinol phosphatase-like enzyme (inositol monophosphatase family)
MKDVLEFALDAALEAGRSTLSWFRSPDLRTETKEDRSPVTRADREAEEILRDRIGKACPDDGILGEEFGETSGSGERRWILDPIDGTKSFLRGVPLYGTLVALEEAGRAVLGVIHIPALGEIAYAAVGEGAWWIADLDSDREPRPARVSEVGRMQDALLCTTSVRGFVRLGMEDAYRRLRSATGLDRGFADCYGHLLVATGRAEIMVDPRMAIWDCAALQPVVEEAGGTFTDLDGAAIHTGGSAVSTNGLLFDEVARLLA